MILMKVSDIMTKVPVTLSPAAKADEVAGVMRDRGISSVILVTHGKPVGIVTERDLVHRVLAPKKDPSKLMAGDVSSKPVIVVNANSGVEEAVEAMVEHSIRRLVVVDDLDRVVGVLTTDDVGYNLRSMSEKLAGKYLSLTKRK